MPTVGQPTSETEELPHDFKSNADLKKVLQDIKDTERRLKKVESDIDAAVKARTEAVTKRKCLRKEVAEQPHLAEQIAKKIAKLTRAIKHHRGDIQILREKENYLHEEKIIHLKIKGASRETTNKRDWEAKHQCWTGENYMWSLFVYAVRS